MAEKIGYSLGDCSANLVFQMMMIYQTKFYTDIFGLEGAIAGTVMLVEAIRTAWLIIVIPVFILMRLLRMPIRIIIPVRPCFMNTGIALGIAIAVR